MAQRTNEEWVEALNGGAAQQEALEELNAVLHRSALFYLRRRMNSSPSITHDQVQALAEDAAQDASMIVLQRLSTFRGEAKFVTWAASIAVACAIGAVRRRRWRDVSLDRVPDGWQEEPMALTVESDGWGNPQLASQRQEVWDVIREVVQTELTERQRLVLNLVVINGVSTEEVETLLKTTPSALYKLTHDARRKLKAGLLKRGFTTSEILSAFAVEA